jgi:hypothetical protein
MMKNIESSQLIDTQNSGIHQALVTTIFHFLYFLVLLWGYSECIVKMYAHQGFQDNLNPNNLMIALPCLLVLAQLCNKKNAPSSFFLHLTLGIVVTPSLIIFCGSSVPSYFAFVTVSAFLVLALVSRSIRISLFKFPCIPTNRLVFILLFTCIFFITTIFTFGGARYLNFNLLAVYDFRSDAAENLPGIYGYISSWVGKVIIPFGITLSFLKKQWKISLIFLVSSVLLFGLTSHKAPLFYPFVLIFFYWVAQKKNLISYLLLSLIFVVCLSNWGFYSYLNNSQEWPLFSDLILRRSIMLPPLLNWFYIDFFSDNPYYLWSHSSFSLGLIQPPFEEKIVNLIGKFYFYSNYTSANTGWIGSGYSQAGIFGVYLYSVLIGCLLSFLDTYSKRLGSPLVIALFSILVISAVSSADLTNMILTHGLIVAIPILMLIEKPQMLREEVIINDEVLLNVKCE